MVESGGGAAATPAARSSVLQQFKQVLSSQRRHLSHVCHSAQRNPLGTSMQSTRRLRVSTPVVFQSLTPCGFHGGARRGAAEPDAVCISAGGLRTHRICARRARSEHGTGTTSPASCLQLLPTAKHAPFASAASSSSSLALPNSCLLCTVESQWSRSVEPSHLRALNLQRWLASWAEYANPKRTNPGR
jgi:hypothetical protein